MRSNFVVFDSPSFGGSSRIEEICKTVEIKQFVPDATVESLDLCVLCRLSGIAELQGDVLLRAPLQHCAARKLAAAIEAHCSGESAFHADRLEYADDVAAAERERDFNRQALAREIVDGDHCSNRSAKIKPVVNEINRPSFVRARNRRDRVAPHIPHVPLAPRPKFLARIPINTTKSPPADFEALTPQDDHQAAISESRPPFSDRFELLAQLRIFRRFAQAILRGFPRAAYERTGLALREALCLRPSPLLSAARAEVVF